ncbi:MAG: prepilin-type N-terminal cleavage/methylation domain-containing protein [Mariprofundaceae bacterium]
MKYNESVKPMNQQGFSLIELLIIVAIIGILASTSIPAYSSYMKKTELLVAEIEIKYALREFSIQRDYSPADGVLAELVVEGFMPSIPNDPWTAKQPEITHAEEATDWFYSNDGMSIRFYSLSHPTRVYTLSSFGQPPM